MDPNFQSLFHTRITFRGRESQVELRVPAYAEVFGLILEAHLRTPERMLVMMPAEFKRIIRSIDGAPVKIEDARQLYADAQAAGQIVAARNRLFETLAEQGRIFMQCPHCVKWEAEVSVTALTVALEAGPWPIVDQRMFLAVPSLAQHFPPRIRFAQVHGTSRIRFDLPSTVIGLPGPINEGILTAAGHIGDASELAAWERWVKPWQGTPNHEQWRQEVPGFRAAVRLAAALANSGNQTAEINLETVLDMPVIDFHFLDNLHYLAQNASIRDVNKATVSCGLCGESCLLVF